MDEIRQKLGKREKILTKYLMSKEEYLETNFQL